MRGSPTRLCARQLLRQRQSAPCRLPSQRRQQRLAGQNREKSFLNHALRLPSLRVRHRRQQLPPVPRPVRWSPRPRLALSRRLGPLSLLLRRRQRWWSSLP